MSRNSAIVRKFLRNVGRRFKDNVVGDIACEDAFCEFDCRKTQCQFNDWSNCANRLSYLALEVQLAAPVSSSTQVSVDSAAPQSRTRREA